MGGGPLMYNPSGNESCNYYVFAQQYACNYGMCLHPVQLGTERNGPLPLLCFSASNHSTNPLSSQGHQHSSRRKKQAGSQVKNDDWVPFRQQVSYVGIQGHYKQSGRKKVPEGSRLQRGNAAPGVAGGGSPLALCCKAKVAPPHGNISPSCGANRVRTEPPAGEQSSRTASCSPHQPGLR